ncbi:MAG: Phosphoenolpyruvate synthase [Patescibacteria group bacterium]|nr:Phosphoenolpyruvate synthase [Patescibacteria group bacterium]
MNKFVKDFKQVKSKDVALVGGKGASLGEMTSIGIPVPSGFVVLASAFDRFIDEANIHDDIYNILNKVNRKDISAVELASDKIRRLIKQAKFPEDISSEIILEFTKLKSKLVAVRSSATAEDSSAASWAGELESYLNTTKVDLLDNVTKCWSSLFTPRAIFYRFEKKLYKTKISVAVVVQTMVQSEVSGICFTVHPVTKDAHQVVVEAGYGLGEAIVSGSITPDNYVVQKDKWVIFDKNISEQKFAIIKGKSGNIEKNIPIFKQKKQKLPDSQIILLAQLSQKLHDHYRIPQDIEWAFTKGKLYIVQSRPITTL